MEQKIELEVMPLKHNKTEVELKRERLKHQFELENKEQDHLLKSCCFENPSDKRLIMIITSFSLSLIVVVFSCYQLTKSEECTHQNLYSSLISLIIGLWIRSPLK